MKSENQSPFSAAAQPRVSPGTPRDVFMRRVRDALGRGGNGAPTSVPAAPAVDESAARLAGPNDDLAHLFATRAGLVGIKVHRVNASVLVKALLDTLSELGATRVAVGVGALAQGVQIKDALRRKGLTIVDWHAAAERGGPNESLAVQYDADAGVTDVHAALAETGTLVCCSGRGHSRGLSLVPPSHIAIVRRSDILPDLIDYWPRLKGIPREDLPSSTALITGPSKTADIEGQLVTGVHGPGTVHVLLVEDA